jgi:inosine/xanthosine triphosphatase
MIIGIASNNRTKIQACKNAVEKLIAVFAPPINGSIEYYHRAVSTSVPDMPLQRSETINGARERALSVYHILKKEGAAPDYAIGLEGGVYQIDQKYKTPLNAFLENWVYVYNGSIGFYGCSPSLPIPREIQDKLYKNGIELSDIIDNFSGKRDVRSNEGAFGILTKNLINRNRAFEDAIINAFIPFFNIKYAITEE